MLVTVRFGSTLASVRLINGSSVPTGVFVTSSSPRTKCDWYSSRRIIGLRILHRLRQRHVEHRPRRPVHLEAGEPRIADDADDAVGVDVFGHVEPEVLVERFLAGS